mmetsp:Transcript_6383/g.18382  ORF Transcript_6383/g.18382 Transcript_6383/m.18382 type:complete len:504 (+) Transcript_6383:259-1770(+)|eukprot:CAMPEP_0206140412 /NCGR_PEP_ID=MMETSP1473-20131121/9366_1 /ASSEMBLY_ACC=CAM_ASM_001109 /TAXON_ID=1461547 /ORGANISM="Stichococcus sp, Strain RCC1054" /LENGTH=503 /DNA_ID=CAMNT_0053534553 /DNA_START=234 /DNA_END=1745 /DNA_ORIENTATION=+
MATTLLEQTRGLQEDNERLVAAIVRDYQKDVKSHKEKLAQNHRVKKALDSLQLQSERLLQIYEDKDGARKEEIAALKGDGDVMATFQARLKEVQDYHAKYPSTDITEPEDTSGGLRGELDVEFSGEESLGRFLDLHESFNRFINSKFGRPMEYAEYVASLDSFEGIKRHHRFSKAYRDYLTELRDYLLGFQQRTQPLVDVAGQLQKTREAFAQEWEAGTVPGWADRGAAEVPAEAAAGKLDVDAFDSVEELETIGAQRLKEALEAEGLKAGGTLRQRAERLMLLRDTPRDKLDRKHFAKGIIPQAARTEGAAAKQAAAGRAAAELEAEVGSLLDSLAKVVEATKDQIEKRSAMTFEEHQAELAEAEEAQEQDSDEEDDFIYNPLKLPMGWDGKPIPYWLYKLHGLNQEFKCEICGLASYWGRRAFERHFKEFKHQNAMRALGIPNSKLFFEVTSIADAQELWRNVQSREKGGFVRDTEEEYEDTQGNVYSKKTYEDLKRQGII